MKMKIKKTLLMAGSLGLLGLTANATYVVSENFDAGQGDWIIRGNNVAFEEGVLNIRSQASGQPGAAYFSFDAITLQDGESLRLTANVLVDRTDGKPRDVRMGLGFADPVLAGDSGDTGVTMKGYIATAPSGGNTAASNIWLVDVPNFFNPGTAVDLKGMANTVSIGSEILTPWVWQVERVGNDLVFSGSLGGQLFGSTITASGANVLDDYRFNTLGLAHVYSASNVATFDNVTLQHIPEPGTYALAASGLALGLCLVNRRFRRVVKA